MDVEELALKFVAYDFVSQIAEGIGAKIEALTNKLRTAAGEHGAFWGQIGTAATVASVALLAVGAASVGIGIAAVKAATQFQQAMELIHTQAGDSQVQVELLKQKVLDLAPAVGMGPDQLAAGLYHIVSVGVPAAQQMEVLRVAAQGAKVGIADMEMVTNALAATMVSGIKGVSGAADAMGQLNAIIGAGNMRMQDMVGALSTGILPAAQNFGLSLRDVGAALATLTDLGTPAEEAATRLRMTFSMMGATVPAAAKELKTIGISATELGDIMRTQGLVPALQDLETHLRGAGLTATEQADVLARAFGGGRSSAAIMGLIENLDRVRQKEVQIAGTSDQFGEAWTATTQNLQFRIDQVRAGMQAWEIQMGTRLMPVAGALLGWLAAQLPALEQWADAFMARMVPAAEQFGAAIGRLLPIIAPLVGQFLGLLPPIIDLAAQMAGILAPALQAVAAHMDVIRPVLAAVVGLWIAWNLAMAAGRILAMVGFLAELVEQFAIAASSEGILTAAQWLLNLAMDANPIGLVILAVAALIAIVVLAITHWSQIHAVITMVWNRIKEFAGWLGGIFVAVWNTVSATIGSFFSWLGTRASEAWAEFAKHPLYWIGYLLVFIPAKLIELAIAFNAWAVGMIVRALLWAHDMVDKAEVMAGNFLLAVGTEFNRLPGQIWDWLSKVFPTVLAWAEDLSARARIAARAFALALGDEWNKLPGQVWDIGVQIVESIIGGIESMAGGVLAAIKDLLPGGAGGPLAMALNAAGVPGFAVGGDIAAGQWAIVGEQGPELFYSGSGGTIVPNAQIANVAGPSMSDTNDLLIAIHARLASIDESLKPHGFSNVAYGSR